MYIETGGIYERVRSKYTCTILVRRRYIVNNMQKAKVMRDARTAVS